MDDDGSNITLVSTGTGRDTCSYYYPDGKNKGNFLIRFCRKARHFLHDHWTKTMPSFSWYELWLCVAYLQGTQLFVRNLSFQDMAIFIRNLETGSLKRLSHGVGYDAESTVSPDGTRASAFFINSLGKKVIFTSTRDGDLDLYTMNLDGSDIRRMTYTPGYDGGAYFSFNNKMMVWRADRYPST